VIAASLGTGASAARIHDHRIARIGWKRHERIADRLRMTGANIRAAIRMPGQPTIASGSST